MSRLLGLSLVALAAAAAGASDLPCDGRFESIADDEIVVVDRAPTAGRGVAIQACGLVPAAPEAVWPIIAECEHFEDFMPRMKESVELSREGNVNVCETKVNMPFPLSDVHSVTHNTNTRLESGGFVRRWKLLRGSYARNNGGWDVLPWPGRSEHTLLVYNVDIDLSIPIPRFILQRAQSATAPDVFASIRERVAACELDRTRAGCQTGAFDD